MTRPKLTPYTPGRFVPSEMQVPMSLQEAIGFRHFSCALFHAHGGKHVYMPNEVEAVMELVNASNSTNIKTRIR